MTHKKNTVGPKIIRFLEKIEDSLLIALLLIMISMAVLQIILRNLFESGILWADPLVRTLVLWIGLIGAMIASRNNHHINIDIITRYLPGLAQKISTLIICIFAAAVCTIMTYFSVAFVRMEKQDGMTAFADIPVWICESIIPVAFAVISVRYILLSITALKDIFMQADQ